jgi:hypothetical protein
VSPKSDAGAERKTIEYETVPVSELWIHFFFPPCYVLGF